MIEERATPLTQARILFFVKLYLGVGVGRVERLAGSDLHSACRCASADGGGVSPGHRGHRCGRGVRFRARAVSQRSAVGLAAARPVRSLSRGALRSVDYVAFAYICREFGLTGDDDAYLLWQSWVMST